MHNSASVLENNTYKLLWVLDFKKRKRLNLCIHGSPNLGQKTRPNDNKQQKKKRTSKIFDFTVPADHRIKLKECEKKDKYLDLDRELKNYGT